MNINNRQCYGKNREYSTEFYKCNCWKWIISEEYQVDYK